MSYQESFELACHADTRGQACCERSIMERDKIHNPIAYSVLSKCIHCQNFGDNCPNEAAVQAYLGIYYGKV